MLNERQKEYVKKHYMGKSYQKLANELNVKHKHVNNYIYKNLPSKIESIRLKNNSYIKNNCKDKSISEISIDLNKNIHVIIDKIDDMVDNNELKLNEIHKSYKEYKENEEIEKYIINHYEIMTYHQMAEKLGLTYTEIKNKTDNMYRSGVISRYKYYRNKKMQKKDVDLEKLAKEEEIKKKIENKNKLDEMNNLSIGDNIGKLKVIEEFKRYYLCKHQAGYKTCLQKPLL